MLQPLSAAALALLLSTAPAAPLPVQPADLGAFPPAAVAQSNLALAEAHVAWVQDRMARDKAHESAWGAWLSEARRRRRLWLLLAGAHRYPGDNDIDLWDLRDGLGWPAYYRGEMPPPVVLEWCREAR